MRKQLVLMGIIALLLCVGLSGCNEVNNTINTERSKFVGKWQNISVTYDFFSDGTFTNRNGQSGTWDLKDGKFILNYTDSNVPYTYNYAFSNNDRTLTLTYTKFNVNIVLTR